MRRILNSNRTKLYVRNAFTSAATFEQQCNHINKSIEDLLKRENIDEMSNKVKELGAKLEKPDLWDEPKIASRINQEYSTLGSAIAELKDIQRRYFDMIELYQLGIGEDDHLLLDDCQRSLQDLIDLIKKRKLNRLMSNEGDKANCYVEILAGVGGSDAFDWTRMLAHMYAQWSMTVGYAIKYVDETIENLPSSTLGGGFGYRRVVLCVEGEKACGHLRAEAGVHRLVRRSPYDPSDKRHTSFAQVRLPCHSNSHIAIYMSVVHRSVCILFQTPNPRKPQILL
jgi:peptide chain release factor 2